MSLNVGSNGGVRVEVAVTQGGRRVAIYRGPGKKSRCHLLHPESPTGARRSLRLGRTLRLVLAGHSGPGRRQKYPASFRRVSDFDTACCHTWDNLAESLRPDTPAGARRTLRPPPQKSAKDLANLSWGFHTNAARWEGWCMVLCNM